MYDHGSVAPRRAGNGKESASLLVSISNDLHRPYQEKVWAGTGSHEMNTATQVRQVVGYAIWDAKWSHLDGGEKSPWSEVFPYGIHTRSVHCFQKHTRSHVNVVAYGKLPRSLFKRQLESTSLVHPTSSPSVASCSLSCRRE